ncbi:hypothetical protein E2C01_101711 [Portunus trituberculatus]|uniref:Uncharacterized protein n=1 Tax=Portunus trituberculatus TaxID=210409 RepID=A0A5B7KL16_PORTR|nr:hypothetical protein [Portunus trituberculatus]
MPINTNKTKTREKSQNNKGATKTTEEMAKTRKLSSRTVTLHVVLYKLNNRYRHPGTALATSALDIERCMLIVESTHTDGMGVERRTDGRDKTVGRRRSVVAGNVRLHT